MQSGLFWGYVSMIEGLIHRLRDELDMPSAPVVATRRFGCFVCKRDGCF